MAILCCVAKKAASAAQSSYSDFHRLHPLRYESCWLICRTPIGWLLVSYLVVGMASSFEPYRPGSWQPCSRPGHHSCLDRSESTTTYKKIQYLLFFLIIFLCLAIPSLEIWRWEQKCCHEKSQEWRFWIEKWVESNPTLWNLNKITWWSRTDYW